MIGPRRVLVATAVALGSGVSLSGTVAGNDTPTEERSGKDRFRPERSACPYDEGDPGSAAARARASCGRSAPRRPRARGVPKEPAGDTRGREATPNRRRRAARLDRTGSTGTTDDPDRARRHSRDAPENDRITRTEAERPEPPNHDDGRERHPHAAAPMR